MSALTSVDDNYDRGAESVWYLEGFVEEGHQIQRIAIHTLPFSIGRHPSMELTLASEAVSQEHAEIYQTSGLLRLRDLGSTNGTYINRRPVTGDVVLLEGDIVHIADLELVVARATRYEFEDFMGKTAEIHLGLPAPMIERVRRLRELLDSGSVRTVFQPIVSLEDKSVLGYEMLGRADLEGLPDGAYELFDIAASMGAEAELSHLFRTVCLESCNELPGESVVFFNTHPAELNQSGLVQSLRKVRENLPDRRLVLEIHEVAITEQRMMRRLRSRLSELDIGLAYDDFGTGQARLVDVVEVPPDYLKFDLSQIRGIDRLMSKQRMLESLVSMVLDLGVTPTAEGVETEAEEEACRALGFKFAQGYHFGRPVRSEELRLAG